VETVNIHEAKTQLSRLIEKAAAGESFLIAKAGKPMVKVVAVDAPVAKRRLGFLQGQGRIPKDFDMMGHSEIEQMFYEAE
jgi:prevent-host-death family protein